jgi:protein-disulfide isomerase
MNPYRPPRLVLPVNENRDHVRGPAGAPVSLVEYGDYECPFCGQAYPVVEELLRQLQDAMEFAYRHFPLTQVHPHAQMAAEAAEAAGAQDRFWDMHHVLFTHQNALDTPYLIRYAELLGLDLNAFRRDLALHRHAPKVREDFLSGVRSGVNGTPTFFINNVRYDGPHDFASMFRVLSEVAEEALYSRRR